MSKTLAFNLVMDGSLGSGFKGMFSGAKAQIGSLQKSVQGLANTPAYKLGEGLEKNRVKLSGLAAELKTARGRLAALKTQAEAAGGGHAGLARQVARAEKAVQTLTGRVRGVSAAYRESVGATVMAGHSVKGLRGEYQGLSAQMDKARKKQQALSDNRRKLDELRGKRGEARAGLMDALALGSMVAAPAKIAIDFEYAMSRVAALSGATGEDLELLTATARKLGRDTVFSASQAAEGMQFLAMAGFNVKETIAAMPGVLGMAAAGAIDLGRAADISSNILSGFKIPAAEMGRVSDVLVSTFTSSNTTLETLGETMKYVAPVASALGVSLEETASMTGVLGSAGIQGSMAGTALRSAMLRLAAPVGQAAAALEKLRATGEDVEDLDLDGVMGGEEALSGLGVATRDAQGDLRPFVEILKDLTAATADMGSAEKMELVKKVFGERAASSMVELMSWAGSTVDKEGETIVDANGKVITALEAYIAKQKAAAGATARISRQMTDNTKGSLIVMTSALQDTAIAFGNLLAPAIRVAAGGIQGLANGLSLAMEKFPIPSKIVVGLATGILTLAVVSKVAAYAFSFIKSGLLLAQGALLRFTGARVAATAAQSAGTVAANAGALAGLRHSAVTGVMAAKTWVMAGASRAYAAGMGLMRGASLSAAAGIRVMGLAFAANPIGLAIMGIITLGTILLTCFDGIRAKFIGFVNTVLDALGPLGRGIRYVGSLLGIGGDDAPEPLALSAGEGMGAGIIDYRADTMGAVADVPDIGSVPGYACAGLGGGASITVEMPISVDMGADGKVFEAHLREHKPEIEDFMRGLMRRLLGEVERQKARVDYAW
ncbi:MAG: phage tail tape measure protein [Deltaproteobacteria bacterium]|jgi:TP901 family phage tail tape measure protein|nr:phage tail tape measure protein [Deltaproteobacteria bacterium]